MFCFMCEWRIDVLIYVLVENRCSDLFVSGE